MTVKKQLPVHLVWIPLCMGLTHLTLKGLVQPFFEQYRWAHALMLSMVGTLVSIVVGWQNLKTPLMFMYSCFFKPLGKHSNQQSRLESFYQDQASIYDQSRASLLRGRKTMLKLCAAQLKNQIANDMNHVDQFEHIYLVDLTPSLCQVAQKRFNQRGWTNVTVLCQDASTFKASTSLEGRVQLVTMSYSLSMMDMYYPVVDRIQSLLSPEGIVGVCDFYVSGRSNPSTSSHHNRQCNWLTRYFWQMWFDLDHIQLGPGRRDYLEYKFGTLKSLNRRNHFIVPYLIQIPYYVWLGCAKSFSSSNMVLMEEEEESSSGSSSPTSYSSLSSNPHAALVKAYQQKRNQKQWRLDYDPELLCHTQFRSYIYAFTWEDPRVDLEFLDLSTDDVLFVITSAGDNALEYALKGPKTIHCVDMNPCQNHLLELKLAAISSLPYEDFWRMFGEGRHPLFKTLLHDLISPHLSGYAFQYWSQHSDRFSHKFYKTGYSGLALSIFEWWVRMNGLSKAVQEMCHASTIEEQQAIWTKQIRPSIFSPMIRKILNNPMFMWNALGVPMNQMNMFLQECTTQEYIENTLDPIASHSLLRTDQYFYYLCMMQRYHPQSCPSYLTREGFDRLKKNGLDCFRLHTDSILNVLRTLNDAYLTRLVVMDHMDWFDPKNHDELDQEIQQMARVLMPGGHVYWRSAGTKPWYNRIFEENGFIVEPLGVRQPGQAIDRVNMYASFYRGTKRA